MKPSKTTSCLLYYLKWSITHTPSCLTNKLILNDANDFSSVILDYNISLEYHNKIQQSADILDSFNGFNICPSGYHVMCGWGQKQKQKKQSLNEITHVYPSTSKKRARLTLGNSLKFDFS